MDIDTVIHAYSAAYPKFPPLYRANKRFEGIWYCRKSLFRKNGCYGEYPHTLLGRIRCVLGEKSRTLHLFSGVVQPQFGELRVDIKPELQPDVCANGLALPFVGSTFDAIVADPPYEKKDFAVYGCLPFSKRECIRRTWHCLKPGGVLVWLDLFVPPFSNKLWSWVGLVMVTTGTNSRVRALTFLEKK